MKEKERIDKNDLVRIWDKFAGFYDKSFGIVGVSKGFSRNLEGYLTTIKGWGVVLDGGCGAGLNFEPIIKTYNPSLIVGLDISPKMLEKAAKTKEKLEKKYECRIKLEKADLCEGIPFPDETFDLQVFQIVLYYLPAGKWKDVLKESYRTAKPGGYVISSNVLKGFNFRREVGLNAVFKDAFRHPRAVYLTLTKLRSTLVKFQNLEKEGFLDYPTEDELIGFHNGIGLKVLETKKIWNKTLMIKARKG